MQADLFVVSSINLLSSTTFTNRTCNGYYKYQQDNKKYVLISDSTDKQQKNIYNFCNLHKIVPKMNFKLNGFYFNISDNEDSFAGAL
jgi:hypothetical protein